MLLQQFYLGCLAHASYLIGDEKTGIAAVVDPQRDIDLYLEAAARHGMEIRYTFLTHFHADFLAGHLELRDQVGAEIVLGSRAEAEYAFHPLAEGEAIEFGDVRLQALHTPGHTPESICLLLFDRSRGSERPYAVLTGDTLFVGDVGRPDLRASLGWSAKDLGDLLYDSVHQKLLKLPDETLIYPAHGAGSLCGKALSTETVSTLGVQKQVNYALQPMSREQFLDLVLTDQPDAPPYFTYDAVLNTRERPTLDRTLEQALRPLSLEEVLRLRNEGMQILDARDPADFARTHMVDSINIGLGGQYATWCGTILDRETPIVLIANPGREREAATRLGRIGFDQICGYLENGMLAIEERPDLLRRHHRITAGQLAEMMTSEKPPVVLDIRNPAERRICHIEGSLHIPLNHLAERIAEVPHERPVVICCRSGYRSSIAASLLQRHGVEDVSDLEGGMNAWQTMTSPVQG